MDCIQDGHIQLLAAVGAGRLPGTSLTQSTSDRSGQAVERLEVYVFLSKCHRIGANTNQGGSAHVDNEQQQIETTAVLASVHETPGRRHRKTTSGRVLALFALMTRPNGTHDLVDPIRAARGSVRPNVR